MDVGEWTFYADELGWFVAHEGWMFVAGSMDYCLRLLGEMEAAVAAAGALS